MIRLAVLYLVYVIAARIAMPWVIFPTRVAQPLPEAAGTVARLQTIKLDTDTGPVKVWFVPGDGVDASHPGPAVIYAHGNAELIDYQLAIIAGYRKLGVSVMMPEFRGYGGSAGSPSEAAITGDFVKAYDILSHRPEVDPRRILFHGRSIGSGVACALAARRKPAALILTSPLYSVTRIAGRYLIPPWFVSDPFDNASVVRRLDVPILIFHGTRDHVIPFRDGRDLAALAHDGKFITYDCGHNDFPIDSSGYWTQIAEFLRERGLVGRSRSGISEQPASAP